MERIASGGMGDVWQAHDALLERTVAVKMLKPEYAGNAEFRLRMRREARHVAGLNHPGIARMYDYGEEPQPYLVMEFVDGEALSTMLTREGALDSRRTASFVAQTAEALACAHERRIVHRDVKPDNLLVTGDGVIKVTDFGLALAADGVAITQAGTFMGTPRYASPEQVTGKPATASSDLYALGLVAYECLTGAPPFQGGPVAVALANRDKPLPTMPARVPEPMRRLVIALTAKDPAQRPAGAALVADWARQLAADPEADVVPLPGVATVSMAVLGSSGVGSEKVGVTSGPEAALLDTVGAGEGTLPPGAAAGAGGDAGGGASATRGAGSGMRKRMLVWSGIAAAVLLAGGLGWLLRPSAQSAPSAPVIAHSSAPRGSQSPSIRMVTMPPVVRVTAGPQTGPGTVVTPRPTSATSTNGAPVTPAPPKSQGNGKGHKKGKGNGNGNGNGNGKGHGH